MKWKIILILWMVMLMFEMAVAQVSISDEVRIDAFNTAGDKLSVPFTFDDGILTVDGNAVSPSLKKATISIPHQSDAPVHARPPLYILEDGAKEWTTATPYQKGSAWYNRVSLENGYYVFNVEHFSSYSVGNVTSWVDGIIGNGLQFGGNNQHISTPWDADYKVKNKSICVWTRPTSTARMRHIGTNTNNWNIDTANADLQPMYWNASNTQRIYSVSHDNIVSNSWNHVCVVFNVNGTADTDCVNVSMFHNGTWFADYYECGGMSNSYGPNFNIGTQGGAFYMNGTLDEFKFWNESINETEVNCIWSNESNGQYCAGLRQPIIQYNLNSSYGQKAYDAGQTLHNGTLVNYGYDFSSLQTCLDTINNTANSCYVDTSNYTETLNGKSYMIGDAIFAVQIGGSFRHNLTIHGNNTEITKLSSTLTGLDLYYTDNLVADGFILRNFDRDGIYHTGGATADNVTIINNTAINCTRGLVANYMAGGRIINNTIINSTLESFWLGFATHNITVKGNRFEGGGQMNSTTSWRISQSYEEYDGRCYDTTLAIYTADYGSNEVINLNDKDVSDIVTGLNNFSLWLCNDTASNVTLLMEEPQSLAACIAVCGGVGLDCSYFENNYLTTNGISSNYTYNNNTICGGGYEPAYLRFSNTTWQYRYPVIFNGTQSIGNNFTENTITHRLTDSPYSLALEGTDSLQVWLNNFYTAGVHDLTTNTSFCVNGQGNFYEESITSIPNGDCGQSSISTVYIIDDCSVQNLSWSNQSSIYNLTYHIFRSDDGASWEFIDNTTELVYDVKSVSKTGTDYFRIVPFDGFFNATNAEKQVNTTEISEIYPRSYNWMRPVRSTICGV